MKGPVAQLVEPTAHNGLVAGSSPARPTIPLNEEKNMSNALKGALLGVSFSGSIILAKYIFGADAAMAVFFMGAFAFAGAFFGRMLDM